MSWWYFGCPDVLPDIVLYILGTAEQPLDTESLDTSPDDKTA